MKIRLPKYNKVTTIWVIVLIVLVGGIAAFVAYGHHYHNGIAPSKPAPDSLFATNGFDCSQNSSSPAQIESFIQAYQKGRAASIETLAVYGTNAMNFYATCHSMTTDHHKIANREYSYADASPVGPTDQVACSLRITGTSTAVATCGSDAAFTLSGSQ